MAADTATSTSAADGDRQSDSAAPKDTIDPLAAAGFGVGLVVLAFAGFFLLAHWLKSGSIGISLFGGLALLSVSLAGLIIVSQALGLADARAALGLPPGSVRALLALSLVVVFVLIASWELGWLGSKPPPDQTSQDIAKQVLTIVATVLVTVVGFYFGSNSAGDATRTASTMIQHVRDALAAAAPGGAAGPTMMPSASELAKTAAAIGSLASAAQNSLAIASQHRDLLREAVTKAGDAGKPLQATLADAEKALAAMQAKVQALATDADRAKAAAADAAATGVTPDKLQASAQRIDQLRADATQANHEFAQAAAAFETARDAILKQTAQG